MMQGEQARIYTPYIICGKEMYQDLTELTKRTFRWRSSQMMWQAAQILGDAQII